jgi:hypothetical protein
MVRDGEETPSYVERATGALHFNRCQGCYRLVMRGSDGRPTALNLRVFEQMRPKVVGKDGKRIIFLGQLAGDVRLRTLSIRLQTDAAPLLKIWNAAIDEVRSGEEIVPEKARRAA